MQNLSCKVPGQLAHSALFIWLILFGLALCFGGTAPYSYPLCVALLIGMASLLGKTRISRSALILLALYSLFCVSGLVSALLLGMKSGTASLAAEFSAHPVLLLSPFLLYAFFLLAREIGLKTATRMLFLLGLGLSAIAIFHWFQDSGKLFHIFAPEHVLLSYRARWPFVNPNHLSHMLLIPFAAGLVVTHRAGSQFLQPLQEHRFPNSHAFFSYLATSRVQTRMARCMLAFIGVLSIFFAILATSSRSGLLAAVTILGAYLLFHMFLTASRPQRRISGLCIGILALAALILLFLAQYSSIFQRVFGERMSVFAADTSVGYRKLVLDHSQDMLWESPFFGIGLGQWHLRFSATQPDALAGIDPEFLHNDPLQVFIEQGLFGFLLLAGMGFFLLRSIIHLLKSDAQRLEKLQRGALFLGVSSLMLASFFDFPFRIPAISSLALLTLALITESQEW